MTTAHFVLTETEVIEMFLRPGWCAEVRAGDTARAREEVRAHLDRWCAEGMRFRELDGRRTFDPVDLNFVTARGLTGSDPFMRERATPFWRAAASPEGPLSRSVPGSPMSERFHDPRRISLSIRRELPFAGRAPGTNVIVTMPLPVEGPTQRQLVVTPLPLPDGKSTVQDGLLVARTRVGPDGCVRVGARLEGIGYQQTVRIAPGRADAPSPDPDPALAPYLARAEGLIRVSPRIEAVAARLVRRDPWETVRAIWNHVFETKKIGGFYYHELDPDDPVGAVGEWVDCYVGSALIVSLARAAGLPARLVRGVLLNPPCNVSHHYWSEIHLPPHGWIPLDLYSWVLAAGDPADSWSGHLVGHLPYQLVTQHLPSSGLELGVAYPPRWYAVSKMVGHAQEDATYDLDTGALVKRDTYEAEIGAPV